MHYHGKFGEDPSNRCLDMTILLLSRERPSAMLDLRAKRTLFLAKSARTLTHFILRTYFTFSRVNFIYLFTMQFTELYGLHFTINIK